MNSLRLLALTATLLGTLLSPLQAIADEVLARYGFDDHSLPTVADGFFLFENARGSVDPTDEEKFSGYRSLELREAPLDHEFVELQAIIDPVRKGEMLFHFAILVRTPDEDFNIALAGPNHFTQQKDGISFWLRNIDGMLFHNSDSMPKRLFALEQNRWYVADVVMHLDEGTYDLRIVDVRTRTVKVFLKNQINATNTKASAISKLSFIGDLEDRSSANYFVDDVELRALSSPLDLSSLPVDLGTGEGVFARNTSHNSNRAHVEAAAPSTPPLGYFDEVLEIKRLELEQKQCVPATDLRDFGISREELKTDLVLSQEVQDVISAAPSILPVYRRPTQPRATAVLLWRQGCLHLAGGGIQKARALFDESLKLSNQAPVVLAAAAIAAGGIHSEQHLLPLYSLWAKDARLPVLLSILAATAKNYNEAREALSGTASQQLEQHASERRNVLIRTLLSGDNPGHDELREMFGDQWKTELDELYIAQAYYYALLFSRREGEAEEFADERARQLRLVPPAHLFWLERRGDALALLGRAAEAKRLFERIADACLNGVRSPVCSTAQRRIVEVGIQLSRSGG